MSRQIRKPTTRPRWVRVLVAAWLTCLAATDVGAISGLPHLGDTSRMSIERETRLGGGVYNRLLSLGLVETQPLLDRYINDVGYRLLAGVDNRVREYRFFIVRDGSVNAFALPGGFIGINRGLILKARTQHQLASVIAHEIAHVHLRHGIDMMERGRSLSNRALVGMLVGMFLGAAVDSDVGAAALYGGIASSEQAMVNYTRDNEYEADRFAVDLMRKAGFDTRGVPEFFRIMTSLSGPSELGSIEYLRTHPVGSNRVAEAAGRVREDDPRQDQLDDYNLFRDFLYYASNDHLADEGSEYLRALAAIRRAEYQHAEALLDRLYRSDSENIWYSIAYAENLEHLNQIDEAELVYRRLLDIFPGDYVLSIRLLRLLKLKGRYQSALSLARELENRFPQRPEIYFELSDLYESLQKPALKSMAEAEFHRLNGNPQQAIRLYDQILKSGDADIATESKAREKRLQLLQRLEQVSDD
ncbi:MAG: M48 family metalloprotease [Gammaproteobacteria bacterium]|nr:M48 family metalloprotease [Gammaproteobacteria bacterium]